MRKTRGTLSALSLWLMTLSMIRCAAGFLPASGTSRLRHGLWAREFNAPGDSTIKSKPCKQRQILRSSSSSQSIPEEYKKSYYITGRGQSTAVEAMTNTGHQIQTDLRRKMGGKDSAPQPVETLLSALLGCTQATAVFVGRQMKPRLNIEKMEFELSASRDERGALKLPIENPPSIPSRLQVVSGVVRVYAEGNASISDERLALLSQQTEARCPVANMMIASGCKMDVEWTDGSKTP